MIVLRQNNYSLQSGSPDKKGSYSRELGNKLKVNESVAGLVSVPYAAIGGGLTGLHYGAKTGVTTGLAIMGGTAILTAIYTAFQTMGANKRRAEAENLTMDYIIDQALSIEKDNYGRMYYGINIGRYLVEDGDPKKFDVTFAYEDGKGVIYVKKDANDSVEMINKLLEDIVALERKADYDSTDVGSGYLVRVILPYPEAFSDFMMSYVGETKKKICCLTQKSLKF